MASAGKRRRSFPAIPDTQVRLSRSFPVTRPGRSIPLLQPYLARPPIRLVQDGLRYFLTTRRSRGCRPGSPGAATLTFDEASYSSKYLTFVTVESQTINRTPLQPATRQERKLWNRYTQGAWPFLDVGNRFYSESLFSPAVLQGKTANQIASALSHPSSPIAQAVDGSANVVIAAVCSITGNQPSSVCDTPTISAIERGL